MATLTNEQTMTQCNAIADWLVEHGEIDKPTALVLCDCDRLGARIWDLRHKLGMNIETKTVTKKNRFGHVTNYAVYRLVRGEEPA